MDVCLSCTIQHTRKHGKTERTTYVTKFVDDIMIQGQL